MDKVIITILKNGQISTKELENFGYSKSKIAMLVKNQVLTERMVFSGTRMEIRMQAAVYAIEMLCDYIESCYEETE